ncbi:unnamed protein product [Phytophthora fragariaefolia]|uniref:Unnamed protein product n=1 Tax=Phytophthora fragariaefolia TaxID=1490495 RepID=A0A9W6YCG7_9STRA|nr:unnamed protein product [Phytophthora fragariaefolia]
MTQRQPEEWRLPCHPEAVFNDAESAKQAVNLFARDHGYALVCIAELRVPKKYDLRRLIVRRNVSNERQRVMDLRVGSMSRIEHLLNELQGEVYFVGFQQDINLKITHLFFAYVPAINISRENFDVVQLDCTYKTNRYGLSLLNIMGTTGMNTLSTSLMHSSAKKSNRITFGHYSS